MFLIIPTLLINRSAQKLRRVILQDELGICAQLDALMDNLVNTYQDEWAQVVKGDNCHSF
jgi:NAD(P)H-nitrite reductase large subunit